MTAARRKASVLSHSDRSEQLYNLFNGATGEVDGEVGISALSSSNGHFIDSKCLNVFKDLQAGEIFDLVLYQLDLELNSSSHLDETFLGDTKVSLSSQGGYPILKVPLDSFTLWLEGFRSWSVIITLRFTSWYRCTSRY